MIILEAWSLSEQALHWLLVTGRQSALYALAGGFLAMRVFAFLWAIRLMRLTYLGFRRAREERKARREAVLSKPWGSLIDLHPAKVKTRSDTMPD